MIRGRVKEVYFKGGERGGDWGTQGAEKKKRKKRRSRLNEFSSGATRPKGRTKVGDGGKISVLREGKSRKTLSKSVA